MAWVKDLDSFDQKHLGADGDGVIGAERHVFYNNDADLTEFNVIDPSSSWVQIHGIEDYTATDNTNKIEIFDGKDLVSTKEGKTSSELKIGQTFKGWLNSIGVLKSKQLWYAECLFDDRDAKDTSGNYKYQEIRFVQGKLTNITEDKGDAEAVYKINGEGSYTVPTQRKVFRGITPVNVTVTPTGGATASTGVAKTLTVTGTDFVSSAIDLSSLTASFLMGEVTSINIIKKSGTPTMVVAVGGNDAQKSVTFTGTGSVVVYAEVVTANGGKFTSSDLTITVS